MLYEDLLFLWLAFLIGEFSPSFSFSFFSSFFLLFLFFLKEILFFLSLFYFSKKISTSSEKSTTFLKNIFILVSFLLFFLDLTFFQFNKVLHQIYYGSILSLFWFFHYFISIKLFLFRISKAYFRIILGLFIPFLFLIMVRDTLEILELKFKGDFILGFLFILFVAPFFIVKTWPLKPLRNPFLRNLILEFLSLHKVKFKEIYVIYDKEKKFFTAGIVGLIPPFRYLFFSNNLLEILEPEEILGVLAHEIGHIKKRHFFWLLLVLFNFPFFLLVSFIFVFYPLSYFFKLYNSLILEILIASLFIILSLFYLRYVFAYFLRQFEREADLYSLYLLRDERPLMFALLKIGEATKQLYKKSWHHYGILERIEFLNKAKKEFLFLRNFTKKIKILLLIWIFINLTVVFFFKNFTFYFFKILINF